VLVVAEHLDTRAQYVDALLAAGYMVHAVATPGEAEPTARATKFDIAVIDSALDEPGLAVAERLAALRWSPRLVAVTTRAKTLAPLEWLFDAYLVKPCPPWDLVDAVRSVQIPLRRTQDLLIIARDRVGISDVLQRFGGRVADVDFRLDLRRGERRQERRHSSRSPRTAERRRTDRRVLDVDDQLRSAGVAFVSAANRS
jgi:DNA-binding response OmpR family regulator